MSPNQKLVVKLKGWVIYNIIGARPWHDYFDTATESLYQFATDTINDEGIVEQGDLSQIVWMKNADRAFMLRPGYAFPLHDVRLGSRL
jgi:hypothetical protein